MGCPVVGRATNPDTNGNYWCCHTSIPCKVGVAPHPLRPNDMVVLSKSAILTLIMRALDEQPVHEGDEYSEGDSAIVNARFYIMTRAMQVQDSGV